MVCRGRAQSGEWCWWGWHTAQTAGPGMPLATSLPLPGSLPTKLRKSLLLIPVPGAEASPSSGRTLTHATLEARAWFHRCGPKWFRNSSLHMFLGAPLHHAPGVCVAEGSRGLTTTSCRGRKGDSGKACDLTEVTQQIKGENERTRVHNSHLRLFPLLVAAFCVQGPR